VANTLWVLPLRHENAPLLDEKMFSGSKPNRSGAAAKLIEMVRRELPADRVGLGTFTCDDHNLTVSAPADVQELIAAAVDTIKADVMEQVSVRTQVFMLDQESIQGLDFSLPRPGEGQGDLAGNEPVFLEPKQLSEMTLAVRNMKEKGLLTSAPRLTLFNRQVGAVLVSTDQTYVAGFTAKKLANGQTGYDPKSATVPAEGIILQCWPNVSQDRKSITLKMRVHFSRLVRLDDTPFEGHKELVMKVPTQSVTDIDETVELRGDQSAIFAGDVDAKTGMATFVSVKATVVPQGHGVKPTR